MPGLFESGLHGKLAFLLLTNVESIFETPKTTGRLHPTLLTSARGPAVPPPSDGTTGTGAFLEADANAPFVLLGSTKHPATFVGANPI